MFDLIVGIISVGPGPSLLIRYSNVTAQSTILKWWLHSRRSFLARHNDMNFLFQKKDVIFSLYCVYNKVFQSKKIRSQWSLKGIELTLSKKWEKKVKVAAL